jgi:hypothetical protein
VGKAAARVKRCNIHSQSIASIDGGQSTASLPRCAVMILRNSVM